jgi:hypothetical protein
MVFIKNGKEWNFAIQTAYQEQKTIYYGFMDFWDGFV